ncbi:MAG: ATP synthase F0 subunit B [Butyrivibrio sp.]|nr:ATP synthase F0 subunit B [Butyrivibrio sp.]
MLNISIVNIVCTIINLLILYFVFKKFLFGRVDEILAKRQEEVDSATATADKAIAEAMAQKSMYEEKISLADEEKETILADIKKQGYDEYDRIVTDARKKGDQIVKEARHKAMAEAERAKEEYAGQMRDMVIDAASKIAATDRDKADDYKLYDKFINEAKAVKNE